MVSAADATTNGPAASTAQESEAPVAAADGSEPSDLPKDSSAATEQGGAAAAGAAEPPSEANKWPGWPGDNVFRMIVPVTKVGSIIGRKGELIKKMCEETGARIRILEGALGTNDRIVLVSGKEEPEAQISPAMDGVIRVFKRINGISDSGGDGASATALAACSARLLVASSQAISLIGKGGGVIKSIQEGSGGSVRVLPGEELPFYATSDERIVDIQGDSTKVVKALELVLGHLRKFLVDHGVIPLFEKSYNSAQPASIAQDRVVDTWADKPQSLTHPTGQAGIASEFSLSLKRDPLFREQEPPIDSQSQHSGLSLYGQDPVLSGLRSSGLGRTAGAFVTQITQSMQIPLSYAEDIIGIGGANIAYIRRTSGAILSVQESRGLPDEITVEIKGTSTQVQTAQQLIQEFIAGHKEPAGTGSGFGNPDAVYTSPYSRLGSGSYLSSLASQSLGGYGSSGGLGGYGGYRF